MPLYTGGAIPAVQKGADAAVGIARAKQAGGQDLSRVNLVRAYFGQKVGHKLVGNPEGETEWWNHGFPTWPFYNGNPWWLPAYIRWTDFNDRRGSRGHIVRSG